MQECRPASHTNQDSVMSDTFQIVFFPAAFLLIGIGFAVAMNCTDWFKR